MNTLLRKLSPVNRFKRWDSVGTVWKYLAGNPDANDLRIINSSLNDLIDNNNKQITINRQFNNKIKELAFNTVKVIEQSNSLETHSIVIYMHLEKIIESVQGIIDSIESHSPSLNAPDDSGLQ